MEKKIKAMQIFCDLVSSHEICRNPILQNGYLYTTDTFIMCRTKDIGGDGIEEFTKYNCEKMFLKCINNNDSLISQTDLADALKLVKLIPEVKEITMKCTECDGGGEVEYEYKSYSRYFDCPVCDGEGKVDRDIETGNIILDFNKSNVIIQDITFKADIIDKLLKFMQAINVDNAFWSTRIEKGTNFLKMNEFEIVLISK